LKCYAVSIQPIALPIRNIHHVGKTVDFFRTVTVLP